MFDGAVYDPMKDKKRLTKQIYLIRDIMIDGVFRTLNELHRITGAPEASISAQLRNLKKVRWGNYRLNKKRRLEQGLWEYQLLAPLDDPQMVLYKEQEEVIHV